jgi:hypothetical protein
MEPRATSQRGSPRRPPRAESEAVFCAAVVVPLRAWPCCPATRNMALRNAPPHRASVRLRTASEMSEVYRLIRTGTVSQIYLQVFNYTKGSFVWASETQGGPWLAQWTSTIVRSVRHGGSRPWYSAHRLEDRERMAGAMRDRERWAGGSFEPRGLDPETRQAGAPSRCRRLTCTTSASHWNGQARVSNLRSCAVSPSEWG